MIANHNDYLRTEEFVCVAYETNRKERKKETQKERNKERKKESKQKRKKQRQKEKEKERQTEQNIERKKERNEQRNKERNTDRRKQTMFFVKWQFSTKKMPPRNKQTIKQPHQQTNKGAGSPSSLRNSVSLI